MNALTILTFSALSWAAIGAWLANHLWQSTAFAGVVWLLTLLLSKNRAETRYSLWLIASAKFLLPFSVLIGLGSRIAWPKAPAAAPSSVFVMTQVFSEPFAPASPPSVAAHTPDSPLGALIRSLPFLVLFAWSCGCAAVLFLWWRRRRRLTMALRGALRMETGRELEALRRLEQSAGMTAQIELRISEAALEPGVLGIFRPVLLLPKGISDHLTDAQLEAILTHELCHVRRSDNLAAGFHMLVEAVFWFHPLVWWIGARLVHERERACDEEVLKLGIDPQAYAEGILKVCEFYVESPLFCAAGVTGSNLKKRIEAIMTHRTAYKLEAGKKFLLAGMGIVAVTAPIAIGFAHPAPVRIRPQTQEADPFVPEYQVISLKPNKSGKTIPTAMWYGPNGFTATNLTLRGLICEAYGVQDSQISGGPDWVNSERYDLKASVDDSVAEAAGKFNVGRQRIMLQHLLSDQFKLSLHSEIRDLPVYELIVAKDGPKLIEANPGDASLTSNKEPNRKGKTSRDFYSGNSRLTGEAVSLAALIETLSRLLGRPVLDKTRLKGKYDFSLDWFAPLRAPESAPSLLKAASEHSEALAKVHAIETASILMAVSEQLGLELNPQISPVETLVIDHAEEIMGERSSQTQPQSTRGIVPSFEAVTIKPNKTGGLMRASVARPHVLREMGFEPDRFMATNVTLNGLIAAAYGAPGSEILGGPDWVRSENYDVEAKLDPSVIGELSKLGPDQRGLEQKRILQALLADRFRLTLHHETREPPAYVLAIAKDGFKVQEAKPGDTYPDGFKDPQGRPLGAGVLFQPGPCKLVGQGVHLVDLAKTLSVNYLGGQAVVDQTGLSGVYDFTLDCHTASMERGESVLTVLPEQLGLELKPLEVLVIDHAEQITGDESSQAQR